VNRISSYVHGTVMLHSIRHQTLPFTNIKAHANLRAKTVKKGKMKQTAGTSINLNFHAWKC